MREGSSIVRGCCHQAADADATDLLILDEASHDD
jgi:hypothetical protein